MTDKDVAQIYREMELALVESMQRNLGLHLAEEELTKLNYPQWQAIKLKELRKYRKENKEIINNSLSPLPKEIAKHLKEELAQGHETEIAKFRDVTGEKRYNSATANAQSFFKIDTNKVDALIKEVNGSLYKANFAALRMTNDVYRDVIFKSVMFVSNGVATGKNAVDMAIKDFLDRGINCIEYKDGRRVNIADYASMAVRTANQRAYMMGEGEFRKQIGNPLIIISKHNTACELCRPWERTVLIDDVYSDGTQADGDYILLSEAMKEGLFHPRCRHGSGTYYPEIEEINREYNGPREKEVTDYGEFNDAHTENMIQKYKRLTLGSSDPENKQKYAEKLREWQGKGGIVEEEPQIKEFIPAKTIEEINKLGTKSIYKSYEERRVHYNLNLTPASEIREISGFEFGSNYSGIDFDIAKQFNETIVDLSDKYETGLQSIKVGNAKEFFGTVDFATTQHQSVTVSKNITLNPLKMKKSDEYVERIKQLSEKGYAIKVAKGKEMKYIATHEFSHTIIDMKSPLKNYVGYDTKIIKKARKEIEDLFDEYLREIDSIKSDIRKLKPTINSSNFEESWNALKKSDELQKKLKKIKISDYSLKNSDEFMAEAFTESMIGESHGEYSQRVIRIIDKYFKKK